MNDNMNDNKNLFDYLSEWQHTRQTKQQENPRTPSRWLPSPGNVIFTLVMVGLLILTQRTWASNSQSANTPGPSATTINYQGRLADDAGNPQTGTLGMSFAIWDAANGGGIIWGPESHSAVPVTDGLFNVGLGSQTSGGIPTTVWNGDRYLEITVSGETLTPRELIRSVPIAGMALTVPNEAIGTEQIANAATTQMVVANSSTSASNNTTDWAEIPDMVASITSEGGPVLIHFHTQYRRSVTSGAGVILILNIDGNNIAASQAIGRASGQTDYVDLMYATELSPGAHTIKVFWKMSTVNPTGTLETMNYRQLFVSEFKK